MKHFLFFLWSLIRVIIFTFNEIQNPDHITWATSYRFETCMGISEKETSFTSWMEKLKIYLSCCVMCLLWTLVYIAFLGNHIIIFISGMTCNWRIVYCNESCHITFGKLRYLCLFVTKLYFHAEKLHSFILQEMLFFTLSIIFIWRASSRKGQREEYLE